ncbi:MAG TPA: hypothetical protein VK501_10170 [Baekduia sp.]|uniref:hypothetical protein n=1 Tax=Baekduia sp. TaxID=2600305 RepID=UPI002CBB4A0A|nr:hypothetical protein [Baekduia sp.]HMJ34274.1 hypothetical protein [Baekduia sp.]
MRRRFICHLRDNLVGYLALFAALGGTSYAAVRLTPGSVTSRVLAPAAVTHGKLAAGSVDGRNVIDGTLKRADFAHGTLAALSGASSNAAAKGSAGANGSKGTEGAGGRAGTPGPAGPAGPAGADGSGAIVVRARGTQTVGAPHGATTNVPVDGGTWTQAPGDVDLVTGSATITTPSACTGSFGNALMLQVDGKPATFAVAPTAPASTTVTMPIVVTSVMEPSASSSHQITATLNNSCTKSGEDFTVSDVKVDVIKFH